MTSAFVALWGSDLHADLHKTESLVSLVQAILKQAPAGWLMPRVTLCIEGLPLLPGKVASSLCDPDGQVGVAICMLPLRIT